MAAIKGSLLKRTQSRAKRLGLDVKGTYTRGQAKSLRRDLKLSKATGTAPTASRTAAPSSPAPGRVATPSNIDYVGRSGVNRVTSGAGSARSGQDYQVAYDTKSKSWVHEYASGKRVRLRKKVAKAYGYKRTR